MSTSHKASLVLSGLAFGVFVVNQWISFIGWRLELTGPIGATVLSLFLAAGLIVQVWKWIEGNRTVLDFGINLVMIPAHVYAELTIWFRTQILTIGLPVDLPLYIIGLYWVIGLVEVLVGRLGHNLALLKGNYQPPEQRVAELERRLALAEQQNAIVMQSQSERIATCPRCGADVSGRGKRGLQNAMNAHSGWCSGKPAQISPAAGDNHRKETEKEREI